MNPASWIKGLGGSGISLFVIQVLLIVSSRRQLFSGPSIDRFPITLTSLPLEFALIIMPIPKPIARSSLFFLFDLDHGDPRFYYRLYFPELRVGREIERMEGT